MSRIEEKRTRIRYPRRTRGPAVFNSLQKLISLRKEADAIVKRRGHGITWNYDTPYWRECITGTCSFCGATVTIDTDPAPNGVDIGGSAVAIDCTHKEV